MKLIGRKLTSNILSRRPQSNAWSWSVLTLVTCYFMSYLYWNFNPGIGQYLAASPAKVFHAKEYWRLFTSSFIHGDMAHFLSNSLMLTVMGYFVNYHYGSLVYPLFGFISGIFINLYVIWDFSPQSTLVGASGVVHYLWGFWFITYLFIQTNISLNRRLMKVLAVGIFVLAPTEFKANVSYLAHGVGIVLGGGTGLIYFFLNREKIRSYEVWEPVYEEVDDDLNYEAMKSVKYFH
jgi:rhomboid protease GluP